MNKITAYRLLLWALTIVWGGTVLSLSLQSGDQSSALSSGFTERLLACFRGYRALSPEEKRAVLETAYGVVRELAHIAEYTLLGLFTAQLVHSYRVRHLLAVSLLPLAVFAVLDECLQEFVATDRAFQWIDLLKDWFGCLLGISFVWLVCLLKRRKQ